MVAGIESALADLALLCPADIERIHQAESKGPPDGPESEN